MYWFFVRLAIFLLLIFTSKFTVASVGNDSYQGITPAKVFVNYLKVPWINLNSSWEDEVSSSCRDDITTLFESADAGEVWALQMLDAASKIPAGLFTGNIRDLGMYEECIRVKGDRNLANIQGRHCMVSMSMPPKFVGDASTALDIQKVSAYNPTPAIDLNFAASLCLPSSCGVEDILGLVNTSIKSTPELTAFEVEVAQVSCSSVEDTSDNFTLGTILTMSFFGLITVFLVFCTACEFAVKIKSNNVSLALKRLGEFSLYTNALKLLSTEIPPGTMPAIHGLKFLSMCTVITIHRFLSTFIKPQVNLSFYFELRNSFLATSLLVTFCAVDTFFVIAGFLTAYLFLTNLQSGTKFNILELYLHRYFRQLPSLVAILLFSIFILPRLGSGPIWETVLGVTTDLCLRNWWIDLFYLQNFVNPLEMCMPHTWYLAVDMQLFWICPIILYPLFYRPRLGLIILSMFFTASLIAPALYMVVYQYSFLANWRKYFKVQYAEFMYSYTATYNRALPYFVGIFLGYYVVNYKRGLTKVQVTLNWILACIFLIFCFWNTQFIQPNAMVYNATWEAVYVSIGRLGWSLAFAWILYACTHGYGGPLTKFLSLPIFVPLSRLSLSIYLVSIIIQVGINATTQIAEFNSAFAMLYLAWGDLAVSTVAALVFSLMFESPLIVLEKLLGSKRRAEIIKRPTMAKNEKLVGIINEHPDIADDTQVDSEADVFARMVQPDFWRTVSEVLKTLGRRTTKTPVEWATAWQDWKYNQSKNDSQWKTYANGIRNKSTHIETGVSTPEKELLIFLATASNCYSNGIANIEEMSIAEPMKAHSDSIRPQDENFIRKFVCSTSARSVYPNENTDKLP